MVFLNGFRLHFVFKIISQEHNWQFIRIFMMFLKLWQLKSLFREVNIWIEFMNLPILGQNKKLIFTTFVT